ncbi:MAG: protein kinase, partial [Myxococcales bacterium]
MLKTGDIFERYTIDGFLGQGGMGTVYRAHDTRLDRRVAIKIISDTARGGDAPARLVREARAAAALDHPNAIAIFDVGEHEGAPYIVMELVVGHTLRESVGGAVPMATGLRWLTDMAHALSAAHKRGLVHRDIKPENVMVRDDGVIKVLDFGIARRAGGAVDPKGPTQASALATLTRTGAAMGTPLYMAPEQIRSGGLDGRVDQFAWGVVAYELLTGRLPWKGGDDPFAAVASVLTDAVDGTPLDAAGVSVHVKAVILRTLSKKREERFDNMDDVVQALDGACKGTPSTASSSAGPTPMQRYSTEEVREVLARAIERQESKRADTRLGFEELVAAAREVGVDEEVLREASDELRPRESEEPHEGYDRWQRRKKRTFYRHFGIYLVVNFALVLFGVMVHQLVFLIQPAIWWAIGVGIHGIRALSSSEDDYHHELERTARLERKRHRRRSMVRRTVDDGADLLLKTCASL